MIRLVVILAALVTAAAVASPSGGVAGANRSLLRHKTDAPAGAPGSEPGACCAKLAAIDFRSDLPVLIVDSSGVVPSRTETAAHFCTCAPKEDDDLAADIAFKVRGGTNSQRRNKVFQFQVAFKDKEKLLSMPKSKKWVLYAQQLDPFGLHNWLGFNLTRETGAYASRARFLELFVVDDALPLNNKTHYRGIYVALEKPREGKGRVEIAQNTDPADVSGGYLLEFSHEQNDENKPTINGTVSQKQWLVLFPEAETLSHPQLDYIQTYLDSFEHALYGPDFANPTTGWRQFANETAFVDWFLAVELIRNIKHTYHSASFLAKDAGKKFAMGPVWDNVQGFGTCCGYPVQGYNDSGNSPPNPASGGNGISSSGWAFSVCENDNCPVLDSYDAGYGISTWFRRLWQDPGWVKACATRYSELRAGVWSDARVSALITAVKPYLSAAALRTLVRWDAELRQAQYFPTAEAQVDFTVQRLQEWTLSRLSWLDGAFQQAVIPEKSQGPYPSAYPPSASSTVPGLPLAAPIPASTTPQPAPDGLIPAANASAPVSTAPVPALDSPGSPPSAPVQIPPALVPPVTVPPVVVPPLGGANLGNIIVAPLASTG